MQFLALLRGINVGGNNIISKETLKEMFLALEFTKVSTYIQSGNIIFSSTLSNSIQDKKLITTSIQDALQKHFGKTIFVLVLSQCEYETLMQKAPIHWGVDESQKHNILFLLHSEGVASIINQLPEPKASIESIAVEDRGIFWSINKEHSTSASFQALPKMPLYKKVTIRNHNTAWKLLQLLQV